MNDDGPPAVAWVIFVAIMLLITGVIGVALWGFVELILWVTSK